MCVKSFCVECLKYFYESVRADVYEIVTFLLKLPPAVAPLMQRAQ